MDFSRITAWSGLLLGIFFLVTGLIICILCTQAAQTALEYDSLSSFDVEDMHDLASVGQVSSWYAFGTAAIGGILVSLTARKLLRK